MDVSVAHTHLRALAANHFWTWSHDAASLLASLPGARSDRHPVATVAALDDAALVDWLADPSRVDQVAALAERVAEFGREMGPPEIAYFSPEFGLTDLVPQYSGGLGILAGDHTKTASDLGLAFCGVGLFYRGGFFRQDVIAGAQAERYETVDPAALGCVDTGVHVTVPFPGRTVTARVWRLDVGRVPLLLLDTDVEANRESDRHITDRLYSGDRRHRLEQELVLGVGGARALDALGWDVPVLHLNEGHAGFLLLELLDRAIANGSSLAAAAAGVRARIIFTTHTPVPAGIDRFAVPLATEYLGVWADRWDVPVGDVLALGADPDPADPAFNMAAFCLRHAARANGVSRLHGEVSRTLFAAVPGGAEIGHVTNGVHARTWVMPRLQTRFDETLGPDWADGDEQAWDRVDELDAATIRSIRRDGTVELAALVHDRLDVQLDPDALVVGFARRFATYKRADLLLRRPDALRELLADDERPVCFLFAGKAHPADVPGKAMLRSVLDFAATPEARGRFLFVPDYDIAVAKALYAGCDVWLNNPVRPHEASGTSGEKSALNGGLNCSISDGWWDEMADGRNGWTIPGSDADDPRRRDEAEADAALTLLRDEIRTEYHGDADAWADRVRHNWRTLGPRVVAARMVRDYTHTLYEPALRASRTT